MKNVTITLDEKTAAWVRIYAAQHNTSVSRMVGDMLQERMSSQREYEEAMRRFLSKPPFKSSGARYPTRDELYDRPVLRRR